MFVSGYARNATSEYEGLVDEVNDALSRVANSESIIFLGDFNAHVGTYNETWNCVIGRHGISSANENSQYLLQLCSSNGLSIITTFFQHKKSSQIHVVQTKYGAKIS